MPCIETRAGIISLKDQLFDTIRSSSPDQLEEKEFVTKVGKKPVLVDRISTVHDGYQIVLDRTTVKKGVDEFKLWVGGKDGEWRPFNDPRLPELHQTLKDKIKEENLKQQEDLRRRQLIIIQNRLRQGIPH